MTAPAVPRSTALVDAGREWGKPLSPDDARVLTAQIRTSVEQLLPLIRTAFQRRADLALGYASWEAYCDGELVGLRLAVADRQEAVAGLRADGMSTRAIGAALGVDPKTVRNDLAQVGNQSPPEVITGTDGKQHPATRPSLQPTQTPEPVVEHYHVGGSFGGPGENSAECACGVVVDGFDTHAEAVDELAAHIETPEPAATPQVAPAAGSGPTSPAPEPATGDRLPSAGSEQAEQLRDQLLRESDRRTAVASIRSVLNYLTSRVLTPEQLARDYVVALDDFTAADLRFAADTMAALAALKEQ